MLRIGSMLVGALLVVAGCSAPERKPTGPRVTVVGEGATFPAPLYEIWRQRYGVLSGTDIVYRPTGSGRGIEALMLYKVDFAGSEAPLSDQQLEDTGDVLHVPMTIAPVAIVYNAEGVPDGIALTPDLLADIMLGNVKRWDDKRIAWLNPGVSLPPRPITVVHRRDGSGTTRVLTEFLSRVSPVWRTRVGTGTTVDWPTGVSATGNEGLSDFVWKAPGTIGYCALTFARAKRLKVAAIGNDAGRFVLPSLDSATAAAASSDIPPDFRTPLLQGATPESYPITGFTYALIRREPDDPVKAEALARFLWWGLHDGQAFAPGLHFATLPPEVVARSEVALAGLQANGKPLLPDAARILAQAGDR